MNQLLQQSLNQLGGRVGEDLTASWQYYYPATFTNIAFGATQAQAIPINAGMDFLCQAWLLSANLNSATTPTGFPTNARLIRRLTAPIPTAAPLTSFAHMGQLLVSLSSTNRNYMSSAVRADLCTCEFGDLILLPSAIYITANDTIRVSITNNVPALTGAATPAVDAQFAMLGMNMRRNA